MQYDTTILIPHFRTGKMTAYCVDQILKHSTNTDVKIVVIDNSEGEGMEYLQPFANYITIISYPSKHRMQSHGIAFDYAITNIQAVETKYFITMESDSFPTKDGFLDIYRDAYAAGYDMVGSFLTLSGGRFIHPTGAMYTMKLYKEAMAYVRKIPYVYIPGTAMKSGFPHHLMVKKDVFPMFLNDPQLYIDLPNEFSVYPRTQITLKQKEYLPVAESVFHQGMGYNQEDYNSYGQRNPETGMLDFIERNDKIIYRMGEEPGQWLCYYAIAHGKKVGGLPTEVKWMPNRENQQQEYTLMENGIKHLWAVTAYNGCEAAEVQDIVKFKSEQMEDLYNSMDEQFKI